MRLNLNYIKELTLKIATSGNQGRSVRELSSIVNAMQLQSNYPDLKYTSHVVVAGRRPEVELLFVDGKKVVIDPSELTANSLIKKIKYYQDELEFITLKKDLEAEKDDEESLADLAEQEKERRKKKRQQKKEEETGKK